ncbi:MAG: helix-turn-helix transcriptional regulator [Polyangia bacterium]
MSTTRAGGLVGRTDPDHRGFGALLLGRRRAAGLSRAELSRRARVSESTLKRIEHTDRPPSLRSLLRLVRVRALGLSWGEAANAARAPRPRDDEDAASLRIRLAPGFDWLRLLHERDEQLRGAGGHLRPGALCLDPVSAADRCAFLRGCPEEAARRTALPLPALARRIGQALGPRPLQAVLLGIGDGTIAVRLAQGLLAEIAAPRLELCLCDASLPLLCAALRRATAVLPGPPRLHLDAVAGQPDPLGCWLPSEPLGRRDRAARLFALLDGALADLDEEARFLRYGLPGAAPGDLLLLDFEAAAPGARSDETLLLAQPTPGPLPGPLVDWLAGLILRARRDVIDIRWHTEPEPHTALPASHALSVVATVRCRDRRGLRDRRFVLYQRKRYDPEALAACLERWGWQRLLQLRYGPGQRGVALLCRRAAPARVVT